MCWILTTFFSKIFLCSDFMIYLFPDMPCVCKSSQKHFQMGQVIKNEIVVFFSIYGFNDIK